MNFSVSSAPFSTAAYTQRPGSSQEDFKSARACVSEIDGVLLIKEDNSSSLILNLSSLSNKRFPLL